MSSCYLTPIARSQFKALPHYKRVSDVNSFTTSLQEEKINLADIKALGFKITGSDRAVSVSDGKKVQTLKIRTDNQNDLAVLEDILQTVTKATTGVLDLIFNIAGFPTQLRENAPAHLKNLLIDKGVTNSKPGQYFLANYNQPQNSHLLLKVDEMLDRTNSSWSIKDENGSQEKIIDGKPIKLRSEVMNDTVTIGYSASTAISEMEAFQQNQRVDRSISNADGLILGTGMNIAQCQQWNQDTLSFGKVNNLEFGQTDLADKDVNAKVWKYIQGSIYEDLYNSILKSEGRVPLERLFAGGPNNGIRGVLKGIHDKTQLASEGEQINVFNSLIEDFIYRLCRPFSPNKYMKLRRFKETALFKDLGTIPDDKEITDVAASSKTIRLVLRDKYSRLAAIYKALYPKEKILDYHFAASGSVVVDDLSRVRDAREAFCDGLGINENKLFLQQLGAVDGMDAMVLARAALARAAV